MRIGWENKHFHEVCENIFAGGDVPKKQFSKVKTDQFPYPIFSNGEKNNGLYGYTNIEKVTKQSITISARGTIGYSVIREPSFYPVIRLIVLIPNVNIVDTRFLKYACDNIIFSSSGSSIPQLTVPMVQRYKLSLPPIEEQKRILAILDEAFAAIAKAKSIAEKNLQNTKELFESYLQSVFANPGKGWEEKKLGEVCIVERGSSPRPIDNFITTSDDGVNWIKIGDTKNVDKYIYATKEKITKEGALKSRFVSENDFILSNSMSLGKPFIMKTTGYIHDGWFVLRLKDNLDIDFLYHQLMSRTVQNQFKFLSAGAIVKNISSDLVKKTVLKVPPIEEQVRLVSKIVVFSNETKKLIDIYTQKLSVLDELRKSLLQKAFNGELERINNTIK